ncbi:MAG: zinc ribbon domain-containing protein [Candidatus Binatia bacterium]
MASDLDKLYQLQVVDRRLLEKQRRVDRYESELAERRLAISRCAATEEALSAERKDLVNRRAFVEREISDRQALLRERRQRVNHVRTEKELRAAELEVKELSQEIDGKEEELLDLMMKVDDVESRIEAVRREQADLAEADHRLVSEAAEVIEALKKELETERVSRDDTASGLDATVRKRYENVLKRRGGIAVVEVRNGTCAGCHMRVPPQDLIEVLRNRAVKICPSCQRILYLSTAGE